MAKLRVMLIDESQERSAAIADLLKAVQCDVVACFSPEEDLLQQVALFRPDVVIIDIDLPGRDILEGLRIVQAANPRPMVMFSQDDMTQRGINEPAAYRLMRKAAMDQNRRLVDFAESMIATEELLAGRG